MTDMNRKRGFGTSELHERYVLLLLKIINVIELY